MGIPQILSQALIALLTLNLKQTKYTSNLGEKEIRNKGMYRRAADTNWRKITNCIARYISPFSNAYLEKARASRAQRHIHALTRKKLAYPIGIAGTWRGWCKRTVMH